MADTRLSPVVHRACKLALLLAAAGIGFSAQAKEAEPQARTDRYGDPLPPGAIARLGTVRFRHPFWVSGLAFTPDGKKLASACWDGTVFLWDAATGRAIRSFGNHGKPSPGRGWAAFLGVALSPDGKTLFALENQDTTHVWNLATGEELHRFKGGNGFGLALSQDGKTLAVGDGEGKVHLWDCATGKAVRQLGPKRRPIPALAFSPDGKVLACGDHAAVGTVRAEDGASTIRLWDAASGRELRELKGHTGGVTAVAFSLDGRTLVSASHDATLRFWDPVTGKKVRQIQVSDETIARMDPDVKKGVHYGGVLTVAYSPNGRLLATGSYDGTVRIWDTVNDKELHVLRGHGREVASVVFSPDSKTLASGSRDHTIRMWDAASGKQFQPRQGHDGPINNLAVSPDGRIAAAACEDNTVHLWSLETGRQLHVLRGHTDLVHGVAFSPDGRTLATGSADRTVRLWDTLRGNEIRRLPEHREPVYSIAFTAARSILVYGEGLLGTLHFRDGTTGKEIRTIPGINSLQMLQVTPDGKILATADRSAVHILDAETGKELRRFAGSWPRFALSSDGRTLATQTSEERKIHLWSIANGDEIGALTEQDFSSRFIGISSFVFSPDGRLLARIGENRGIELWEVLTGKIRRRFSEQLPGINPLVFSPDGKSLLSGSSDTTVLIWDLARQCERQDRLTETDLQSAWQALADADAEKADRAICALAGAAEQSVSFLYRHLNPAKILDEERLNRLIADLDNDQFAIRSRADEELKRLGRSAETALRQALTKSPSLEARRRMENLLARFRGVLPTPDMLRSLRAIEVLERAGTSEARKMLEKLANGAAQDRLTREAEVSLRRLRTNVSAKHR